MVLPLGITRGGSELETEVPCIRKIHEARLVLHADPPKIMFRKLPGRLPSTPSLRG
jgi:hypothetical protein